jgi:hypothetical protein
MESNLVDVYERASTSTASKVAGASDSMPRRPASADVARARPRVWRCRCRAGEELAKQRRVCEWFGPVAREGRAN